MMTVLNRSCNTAIDYTYIGDDYPLRYPLPLSTVAMTLQESIHFSLNSTDSVSSSEWFTLLDNPQGSFGIVRLGPRHRAFILTMRHQMHCIYNIQQGLTGRDHSSTTRHHVSHCLNYLRQTLLCAAEDGIEKGNFETRNYEKYKVGDTLVCEDWERVYNDLEENWKSWLDIRESTHAAH